MDFCHPCRRHLNGALACPGCGTPVDTLRARQRQEPAVPPGCEGDGAETAGGAGTARAEEPGEEPAASSAEEYGDEAPPGRRAARRQGRGRVREPGESPSAGQSRRDRKAAAHRRRRNRTLLIVAGFVLAAGALSLAELGLEIPGSKPGPAVAGEESPDGGSAEVEPKESASGAGDAPVREGAPSPSASGSPSASASPEDEESSEAEEEPEAEEGASSAPAADPPPADPTAAPADPPSAPETPDPAPTTEEPEPEPEPSETCNRFLWWCT
ncbi:SCO2400 family protein [Streptomyces griseoflavus]|uniref:SCO2400 family protein n=1 Tax=Streptomyces griseoflavus TaxID=35619 RepID=UPI003D73B17D